MTTIPITAATVRVLRSHDYCHFEISLSSVASDQLGLEITSSEVDALRKEAARLADKAVEQYILAKEWASRQAYKSSDDKGTRHRLETLAEMIRDTPEDQRTPEEKAIIKALADHNYAERRYDYQDEWEAIGG